MSESLDPPPHFEHGLEMMGFPGGPQNDEYVAAFTQRWRSLDLQTMARVVREGEGDDKLVAIFAVGYACTPEARDLLLPLLQSPVPIEQWASAICLGQMGEKRALRVLCTMLTDFLPAREEEYLKLSHGFYENWRIFAPTLLGALGEPIAVPPLRHALHQMTQMLRQETVPPEEAYELRAPRYSPHRVNLTSYEDEIVYALGRLGAFGALAGLNVLDPYLELWIVHLTMGHLHGRYPWPEMRRWKFHPELGADISYVLLQRFGLTAQEQDHALELYARKKMSYLISTYPMPSQEQGSPC